MKIATERKRDREAKQLKHKKLHISHFIQFLFFISNLSPARVIATGFVCFAFALTHTRTDTRIFEEI